MKYLSIAIIVICHSKDKDLSTYLLTNQPSMQSNLLLTFIMMVR